MWAAKAALANRFIGPGRPSWVAGVNLLHVHSLPHSCPYPQLPLPQPLSPIVQQIWSWQLSDLEASVSMQLSDLEANMSEAEKRWYDLAKEPTANNCLCG